MYHSNKKYRDHFIHQFWVFALGSYILNHNCQELRKQYITSLNLPKKESCINHALDFAWIFVGLLHDFACPIEQTEYWLSNFFKKFFPTDHVSLFDIQLERLFRETDYLRKMNCLSTLFENLQNGKPWSSIKHMKYQPNFFLSQIFFKRLSHFSLKDTKLKPHALLSALSLLTKFSDPTESLPDQIKNDNQIIYPSSLAISLHHLHPMGDDEYLSSLGELYLSKNILTSILIFSDSAQEWYRLSQDENIEAKLMNFYFKKNSFTIELDWGSLKHCTPGKLKLLTEKVDNHIKFLKAIPKKLLHNDIKGILEMNIKIKTPWGPRTIRF